MNFLSYQLQWIRWWNLYEDENRMERQVSGYGWTDEHVLLQRTWVQFLALTWRCINCNSNLRGSNSLYGFLATGHTQGTQILLRQAKYPCTNIFLKKFKSQVYCAKWYSPFVYWMSLFSIDPYVTNNSIKIQNTTCKNSFHIFVGFTLSWPSAPIKWHIFNILNSFDFTHDNCAHKWGL